MIFLEKWSGERWLFRFLSMLFILTIVCHDTVYCSTVDSVDTLYSLLNVDDESITLDILGIDGEYTVDAETEEMIKSCLGEFNYYSENMYMILCVNEIYDSHPGYSYAGDGKVVIRNYFLFEIVSDCSYSFGIKDGYYFVNFDRAPCEFLSNMKCLCLTYFESGYAIQEYDYGSTLFWNMVMTPDTQYSLCPVGGSGYDVECEYEFDILYRDSAFTFDSSLTDSTESGDTGSTDTGDTGSTESSDTGSADTGDAGSASTGSTGSTNTGSTGSTNTDSTGNTSASTDETEDADNTNDTSAFKEAGEKIIKVFPFCIPFDIYNALKSMRSAAIAPVWETDIEFPSVDYIYQFRVDMADYEDVIYILRWGIFLMFVAGLIAGTYRLIKWKKG